MVGIVEIGSIRIQTFIILLANVLMVHSYVTNYIIAYPNVHNMNSPVIQPENVFLFNGFVIKHKIVLMVLMNSIAVRHFRLYFPSISFSLLCIECANDDFVCKNNQCIKPAYRCDGLPQCRDGSDEFNCNYTVPCTEFQCENGRCIPNAWLCDGVIDCSSDGHDRSDEHNCNVTKCDIDSGREFYCNNMPWGTCLSIAQLCDGHDDCGDGSDEKDCNCTCTQGTFSCNTFCECIPVNNVCDGTAQCQDGSDEEKCKCDEGEYTCNGGLCINATQLCNGKMDCPKGDDETYPDCSE